MMRTTTTESRIKIALLATTLLVVSATAQVCRAEIISIDPTTGVTASSAIGAPFDRQDDFIVDGSGLIGGQHTPAVQPNMWLSTGNGFGGIDPDPSVTFDLGAVYTITSFHVWNYNEAPPNLTSRGVNSVSVEFGTTAALGGTVAGITNFAQADGLNTYAGEEFNTFAPFRARFIKFDINSNHGDGNTFYGLSEVQFNGNVGGLVVSPNSFVTSANQGAAVGTLTTPSGDAGDTFTYTLIAGTGDADNSKFQIVGAELQIGPHDFSGAAEGEEFSVRVLSAASPSGALVEAALTLSAVADSDGDGLLDTWEELWAGVGNLGVLSGLAGANADGDSLTDLAEYNLRDQFPGLDPTSADSDGDTLDDGEEIAGAGLRPATDPTNPDSDGDTLSDGVETNTGIFVGPTDTGSDPTLLDTDGDTFNDDLEVAKGSDPNDSDSTLPVTLVGYWPFDGNSDPQPDLSGFANDASVVAGATWVDDVDRGGVMEFSGNDPYLEAADSESLSITGDITIAAWVKVTDYSNWRGIVGKSAGPGGNLPASYDLYLVLNDGRARLYSGSPSGFGQVTGGTAPVSGEWHHVAVTRIGDEVSFYYDGQLDGQGVTTQPMLDSDATLRIGNRTDLVTDFLGRMDDVAIFDGGLSPGQIIAIMEGDFSAFGVSGSSRLQLDIDLAGGELEIKWPSQFGKLYNLRSSVDPANDGDPTGWPIFGGHQDLEATPDLNTLTIPLPPESERFFVIEEFPKPPTTILGEDFEAGAAGWTMGSDGAAGTAWEIGMPTAGSGPPAANGGDNCAGTNLDADYLPGANVWLRSPAINLAGVGGATLSFAHYRDIEDFGTSFASISVVSAADDSLLAEIETGINGFPFQWEEESFPVPAGVLGQEVKFEFRLITDEFGGPFFGGYFIDDFLLTVP